MGTEILRFRSIEEAEEFKWQNIIKKKLPYWKFDRYEYARLHIRFTPGIYRFRTLEEKSEWELCEVCRKWEKQN